MSGHFQTDMDALEGHVSRKHNFFVRVCSRRRYILREYSEAAYLNEVKIYFNETLLREGCFGRNTPMSLSSKAVFLGGASSGRHFQRRTLEIFFSCVSSRDDFLVRRISSSSEVTRFYVPAWFSVVKVCLVVRNLSGR